jgi:hypothetical protein
LSVQQLKNKRKEKALSAKRAAVSAKAAAITEEVASRMENASRIILQEAKQHHFETGSLAVLKAQLAKKFRPDRTPRWAITFSKRKLASKVIVGQFSAASPATLFANDPMVAGMVSIFSRHFIDFDSPSAFVASDTAAFEKDVEAIAKDFREVLPPSHEQS